MISEKQTVKTPNKLLAEMQIVRFGNIAFALQFISLAIMILSIVTFLAMAVYYIVLFVIALFTLFLLFFNPKFTAFWEAGEGVLNFSVMIAGWWVVTAPVTIVLSALSIACLGCDRKNRHLAKIIVSSVAGAFALIYLVANLIIAGASA